MIFKLFYNVENCGDGSTNVKFHPEKVTANKAEEAMELGWGESSVGSVSIKIEDGKAFFQTFRSIDGKYQYVWEEIKSN